MKLMVNSCSDEGTHVTEEKNKKTDALNSSFPSSYKLHVVTYTWSNSD